MGVIRITGGRLELCEVGFMGGIKQIGDIWLYNAYNNWIHYNYMLGFKIPQLHCDN